MMLNVGLCHNQMVLSFLISASDDCQESYVYTPDVCKLESEIKFTKVHPSTTARVCRHLCSNLEPDRCAGIFYDVYKQTCTLTSYTHNGTQKCDNSTSTLLYYRRHRCLSRHIIVKYY